MSLLSVLLLSLCVSSLEGFVLVDRKLQLSTRASAISSIGTTTSTSTQPSSSRLIRSLATSGDDTNKENTSGSGSSEGIDVSSDPRLYYLRLSRATGIEWGTDLSFAFVYVRAMDPTGAAAMSGKIQVGDQLCQLQAVPIETTKEGEEAPPVVNLVGAPFDYVMSAFAGLGKTVQELDMVFFRGSKEELKAACTGGEASSDPDTVTITVVENKGSGKEVLHTIKAPAGCNIREVLTDNNINVYQSITRWTNCKGKQLCGTCIVDIKEGSQNTNRKSMDEESTLRENPDSYRLACIAFAYGDITVETLPPINAAQWTR